VALSAGAIGLWAGFLDRLPTDEAVAFACDIEAAGVDAIWLQEYSGVDPFVRAALYLSATSRLIVALGVAVIYGRDPEAMVAAASTLEEAFPGRFVLGLGVSHRDLVEARGHEFRPPIVTMESYLAAMDRARLQRRLPLRILGALGPHMAALAGRAADGAHTYFSPVNHTASIRAAIGPDRWLAPSQMVALAPNGEQWREAVRSFLQLCLGMPNYTRNLRRLGFTDEDLATTSDALVDALVVPDDAQQLHARIGAHRAAGADHVVLQFVPPPRVSVMRQRLTTGLLGILR
jgi:probable F420-dependent oxidoreductase